MDYYDGNTVTAIWNYAQNFAMSDNYFDTNFGPSTPGALNLISGNDRRRLAISSDPPTVAEPGTSSPLNGRAGTIYGDHDPAYDDCSNASHTETRSRSPVRTSATCSNATTSPGAGSRAGSADRHQRAGIGYAARRTRTSAAPPHRLHPAS